MAPGVQPCESDGVLHGLGTAVGEQDPVEVARGPLGDQPGCLRSRLDGESRCEGRQVGSLFPYRLDDGRVLVAQVGENEAAAEVQVAVSVVIPEVRSVGACHGEGVTRS